jgi:hypothetical protein
MCFPPCLYVSTSIFFFPFWLKNLNIISGNSSLVLYKTSDGYHTSFHVIGQLILLVNQHGIALHIIQQHCNRLYLSRLLQQNLISLIRIHLQINIVMFV